MVASPMVVFLDMDGPIQSQRSQLAGLKYDPVGVTMVNKLIEQERVVSVISSTVRILCSGEQEARYRLSRYGLQPREMHQFWRTAPSYGVANRGREREIQDWLSKHREDGVTYVAIEDDPLDIEGLIHVPADYNGLPVSSLMQLRFLAGNATYDDWQRQLEWEQNHLVNKQQELST